MARSMVIFLCTLLLLLVAACSEQESQPQPQVVVRAAVGKEVKVIVPESVSGKWQSVKIALQDKQEGTENSYKVDIGGSFQIPGTTLRVTIAAFMPSFSSNSERETSTSNQVTNPAVQIVVRDGEKEVHRGWVFALYPERHQFENPRYKFILRDYKPAG